MNANWFTVLHDLVPMGVVLAQRSTNPDGTPLSGVEKTAVVLTGIANAVPDAMSPNVSLIKMAINMAVSMFKTISHPDFVPPPPVSTGTAKPASPLVQQAMSALGEPMPQA